MKVEINKIFLIMLLAVMGISIGWGLSVLYDTYREDIISMISGENKGENLTEDVKAPYFPGHLTFAFHSPETWSFYVFQPKVVEYKVENGIKYIVVEYQLDSSENSEKYLANIVVAREEGLGNLPWEFDIDEGIYETALNLGVLYQGSYDIGDQGYYSEGRFTYEYLQELIPVGNRMSMVLPAFYPDENNREAEFCSNREQICALADIWDASKEDVVKFANKEATDKIPFLFPYSVSDYIYTYK